MGSTTRKFAVAILTPPAHQQCSTNIMASRCLSHAPARAETLFNNANLLRFRPAPTATGIGDR